LFGECHEGRDGEVPEFYVAGGEDGGAEVGGDYGEANDEDDLDGEKGLVLIKEGEGEGGTEGVVMWGRGLRTKNPPFRVKRASAP